MKKTWMLTPLVLVLLAAGSYGLFLYLQPPTLPASVLYGNGRIEGVEVRVAAEVAGRVVEAPMHEGVAVAAGDPLARIDDRELRIRLAQARAEATALEHERQRLEQELATARHHRQTAETDRARYRELHERGTVPAQRLEQAENAFQEARGHVASLESRFVESGARLEAARQQTALFQTQIDKAEIRAPIAGTVLIKAIEAGEFVQPGRVTAVLVDLDRVELRVFLPQREIGKVRLGDPARARVDAFPERDFEARVARIDQRAQFTPRDVHMPEERVTQVFGVTLALANPDGLLKPGMAADAWILWQAEADWPERLVVPR